MTALVDFAAEIAVSPSLDIKRWGRLHRVLDSADGDPAWRRTMVFLGYDLTTDGEGLYLDAHGNLWLSWYDGDTTETGLIGPFSSLAHVNA